MSAWRAVGACPTKSIGQREQPREPEGVFPCQMTDGILAVANTGRCAPDGEAFDDWLDTAPDKPGGVDTCP